MEDLDLDLPLSLSLLPFKSITQSINKTSLKKQSQGTKKEEEPSLQDNEHVLIIIITAGMILAHKDRATEQNKKIQM